MIYYHSMFNFVIFRAFSFSPPPLSVPYFSMFLACPSTQTGDIEHIIRSVKNRFNLMYPIAKSNGCCVSQRTTSIFYLFLSIRTIPIPLLVFISISLYLPAHGVWLFASLSTLFLLRPCPAV